MAIAPKRAKTTFASTNPDGTKRQVSAADAQAWGIYIENVVSYGSVWRGTKAALDLVTPAAGTYPGGVVTNDSTVTNNGFYIWDGSSWARSRGFPDTAAVLTNIGGTANAITADTEPGVTPADIQILILPDPPGTNSSTTVTLALNGGTAENIKTASGSSLAIGDIVDGVGTMFFRYGSEWRQVFPSNVAERAEAALEDAEAAATSAEKWAENPEDVPVEPGKYSAYHWAQKAEEGYTGGYLASTVAALEGKTTLANADAFFITDSAESNGPKKVTFQNLKASVSATDISFTPTGGISSTAVQTAIAELDTEKAPKFNPEFTGQVKTQFSIRVGTASAGGGSSAQIGRSIASSEFVIAPSDLLGSYLWNRELLFDSAGDQVWTAEGGFKTTGALTVTGQATVKGWQVGLTVATIAGLTAKLKSTLTDGDTILVQAEGTGGVFKWVAASTATADGGVVLASDEGGTGRWVRQFDGDPWVEWWGAKASNNTADAAANAVAFQAALDYAKVQQNGIVIQLRNGVYYIGAALDTVTDSFFRRVGFRGNGPDQTVLFAYFTGADKALLDGRHPTGARAGGIVLQNLKIQVNNGLSGPKPMAWAQSKSSKSNLDTVDFVGDFTNTLFDVTGEFNGDYRNVSVWQGGHYRAFRPVDAAARFSATVNTNTITATGADVWEPGDVGQVQLFVSSVDKAVRYTIATVVGPREITTVETIVEDFTGAYGWLDGIKGDISSGSTTLTLNAPRGVASDVGRIVVLRHGLSGPSGTRKPLVTRIAAVPDASTFTLEDAPDTNLTDATVYLSPAFLVRDDPDLPSGETNDVRIDIALETHAGLGALIQGTHVKIRDLKLHGRALIASGSFPSAYDDEIAQAGLILNGLILDADHIFFESQGIDPYRGYVDGIVGGLTIDRLNGALAENQLLIDQNNNAENSRINWGPITLTTAIAQSGEPRQLITTDYSSRLINFWGGISYGGNKVPYRQYGAGVFDAMQFTSDGGMHIVVAPNQIKEIPIPAYLLVPSEGQRSGYLRLRSNANSSAFVELGYIQNLNASAGTIFVFRQLGSLWETSTNDLSVTPGNATKLTAGLHVAGNADVIKIQNRTASTFTFGWTWT